MEHELKTKAVVAEGKPITVTVVESGADEIEKVQVPYGSTVDQVIRASTKFPRAREALAAGKQLSIKVKQKAVAPSAVVEDGDNVIIVAQVKGG